MILMRQKKAWRVFADKRGLRYTDNGFMNSPRLDGVLDGHTVGIFSADHERDNARTPRKLTGIEVQLDADMPFDGAIASSGMVQLAKSMSFQEEVKPDSTLWNNKRVIVTDHRAIMSVYLTEERIKALNSLMDMDNVWVIFAFRNGITLLRIDTPHALDSPKIIDELIKTMFKVGKVLSPNKGEAETLKKAAVKSQAKTPILIADEADTSGLELEDADADEKSDAEDKSDKSA